MAFVGFFDTVNWVIEDASKEIKRIPAPEAMKNLKDSCKLLDDLKIAHEFTSMSAEAHAKTRVLEISIIANDIILEYGDSDWFFDVLNGTDSFSFENEGGDLKISLFYKHIWR